MIAKIYVHGDKESNYETGQKLGLIGDALRSFCYTAYEIELEYEVDPSNGSAKLLKVDGRKLK